MSVCFQEKSLGDTEEDKRLEGKKEIGAEETNQKIAVTTGNDTGGTDQEWGVCVN